MVEQRTTIGAIRCVARISGLLLASAFLTFLLLSPTRAQETLVRIEIDSPIEPVPTGEEFEARVLVEDVDHLAGFSFTLEYDPERVEPVEEEAPAAPGELVSDEGLDDDDIPVRVLDIGAFLIESERQEGIICGRPVAKDLNGDGKRESVVVSCVTTGPPLCLGGEPGMSGSGLLGRVVFKAKGGGATTLKFANTSLVLDDIEECNVEERGAEQIPHRAEDASVQLEGGDGTSGAVIGIIVGVGVVVVVIVGGLGGFLWYRRRAGTAA